MFFKTGTVYKVTTTRKAADAYLARWFANGGARIEIVGDRFFVVA